MSNIDAKSVAKFTYQAFNEREIKLDVLCTLKDVVSSAEILLKNEQNEPASQGMSEVYQVVNCSQDGLKLTLARI